MLLEKWGSTAKILFYYVKKTDDWLPLKDKPDAVLWPFGSTIAVERIRIT